ncbi:N-acetylglucosamine-6-phosphate deacetylase [Pullulanibacillus sp. KACC 23026]|uniref:N-acetylglucosamine-6-phosphate deacetylase n=1 Tax=Pullulanibacillus sp. KACC 23026 TaxID=3028315 RepID=UPI0023AE9BA7|nr:N-acetylglucosamine-6-phosphate deacetylase [Pullulanibacillus sp. KACC 23026]WEG14789.1 N-acetylglucosamine-6-phosphate deacetylase [Pullulanibacillus sp. KACC 23026]
MENRQSFIISGLTIVGEKETIEHGYIHVNRGRIIKMGRTSERVDLNDSPHVYTFSSNFSLIPGMIDVHIHGANGADTMDASSEALDTLSKALPMEGTTSFLATTMTQSPEAIEKALVNVSEYVKNGTKPGHAEILGIHLEGPFISKEKIGAQPLEFVAKPSVEQFKTFQKEADNLIKLVTLAPEEDDHHALMSYLKSEGIVISIGHSNATYKQVNEAIQSGATHVTHLYNGMTGFHHREPGVVGAALLRKELTAELIVDGIHSDPAVIDLAFRQKGKEQLVLITDSMRAKCLKNGQYDLGGQTVYVKDGRAELENGHLAGSVLKMSDAFRNMMEFTNASLEDVVEMTSANPAKELNLFDRLGSLEEGKDADLVVLDENRQVVMTFCKGNLAYERKGSD